MNALATNVAVLIAASSSARMAFRPLLPVLASRTYAASTPAGVLLVDRHDLVALLVAGRADLVPGLLGEAAVGSDQAADDVVHDVLERAPLDRRLVEQLVLGAARP
jgi:hypothetical protein